MHLNLLNDIKVIPVEPYASAATSTLTTDVVDTQGFDSIAFIAYIGDATSGATITLTGKTNTASSTSSPTPVTLADTVAYTAGASDADDKVMILDLHKPRDRYVFATLTRADQNVVLNGIIAVLYNAHQLPVTQHASVIDSTFKNDPSA